MKRTIQNLILFFTFIVTMNLFVNLNAAEESDIIITIETDREYYNLGEKINITGMLNKECGSSILIILENDNFKRVKNITAENKSFNMSYLISYGDPDGTWNISANITEGNSASSSIISIDVSIPEDIFRYPLIWFSPAPNASYPRGSQLNFSIFVTEDLEGVSNSTVACILPSSEKILLTEIKKGYYQQNYTIPWNSPIGEWIVSSECRKTVNDIIYFGGNWISFSVIPATLELTFLEQLDNQYSVNELIPIRLKIQYPDGTSVDKASISLTYDTETFQLVSEGEGIYYINHSLKFSKPGSSVLKIKAADSFGNQVIFHKILTIIPENIESFPLFFLLGILFFSAGVCVFLFSFRKKILKQILLDTDVEIEEIKHLQKETAEKYYIKGDITREVYDSLKKEYIQRLEEINYTGRLKKPIVRKMIYYFKRRKDRI